MIDFGLQKFRLPALISLSALLSGCGSVLAVGTGDVAGIAGAGAANAVTKSAAIATGIGLAVAAGANAGLQYGERRVHRFEQDRIADAGGLLGPGAVGVWSVTHTVPIENDEHGQLVVTREFGNALFVCREIVFSVDTGGGQSFKRAFYTATICRDGERWQWASAEPATERWGSLQ